MVDFVTSEFGSPITSPSPVRGQVSPNATATALASLSANAGKFTQILANEEEDKLTRQANNDLVNNTINPDHLQNKAAYAVTVAEGQALKRFNTLKEEIVSGKYDDLDPEEFQKYVSMLHRGFYEEWKGNPNAGLARGSYNEFFVRNEATLSAGQAGKYRVRLGEKQGKALYLKMSEMAGNPESYTAESMIDEVYSPAYTLLNETQRQQAAFGAASEIARDTGDSSVLQALNKEFAFDVNAQFKGAYDASIAAAQETQRNNNAAEISKFHDTMKTFTAEGVLHSRMTYDEMVEKTKHLTGDGKPVYTAKEWGSMMAQSRQQFDRGKSQDTANAAFLAGTLKHGTPAAITNKAIAAAHSVLEKIEGNTPQNVALSMGQYLKENGFGTDKVYKDMSTHWNSMNPINKDGSVNQSFISTFNTLSNFRDALGSPGRFKDHMDENASMMFKIMDTAMSVNPTDFRGAAEAGAHQVQEYKDRLSQGTYKMYTELPKDYREGITKAIQGVYQGFFKIDIDDEKLEDAKRIVEPMILTALNTGHARLDTLESQVTDIMDKNFITLNGEPQFTQGIPLNEVVGGDFNKTFEEYQAENLSAELEGFDEDGIKTTFDSLEMAINITDTSKAHAPTVRVSVAELQFKNLIDNFAPRKGDKEVDADGIHEIFNRVKTSKGFPELGEQDPQRIGVPLTRSPRAVSQATLGSLPGIQEARERHQRDVYFMNQMGSKASDFFTQVIDNPQVRQYDIFDDVPTAKEWGNMSLEDKTIVMLNATKAAEEGRLIVKEFNQNRVSVNEPVSNYKVLGTWLGKVESFGGSYNAARMLKDGKRTGVEDAGLVDMTVGEIIEKQAKDELDAVGKYQFIPSTLKETVEKLDIPLDSKFSPDVQEQLFMGRIQSTRKNLYKWMQGEDVSIEKAAADLASEWAAVPMITGKKKGKSRYGKGNKALYSVKETIELLNSIKG